MLISFERTGGFAGLTLSTSVDTAQLSDNESEELAALVDQADLFAASTAQPDEPDRFQYRLVVERDGDAQELSLGESAVSPAMRPLIDRLIDHARKPGRGA